MNEIFVIITTTGSLLYAGTNEQTALDKLAELENSEFEFAANQLNIDANEYDKFGADIDSYVEEHGTKYEMFTIISVQLNDCGPDDTVFSPNDIEVNLSKIKEILE